jgi:hydrogenase large subunit
MATKRIVIDPVTRIEGHLRVEIEVKDGKIADAFSSGTMVRGLEIILRGRDPRDAWAFAERTCGVCTTVHALASVRSVEDALGIVIPPNAELVRNLMFCAQYMQDHVVHFYHLHALDWVDIVSALKADPNKDRGNRPQHLQLAEELAELFLPRCRSASATSSRAGNSAFSPRAIGDIPR